MERIDDEDKDLEALITGWDDSLVSVWSDFDLALIANTDDNAKLKIVDFQYQGLNNKEEKLAPLIQSELPDWTYEFEGISRSNDVSDYEVIHDIDIYLAESVDEERMEQFSNTFYGDKDHWRYRR